MSNQKPGMIAKIYAEKTKRTFVSIDDFQRELKAMRNGALHAAQLVYDNLDGEKPTGEAMVQILYDLVNDRLDSLKVIK